MSYATTLISRAKSELGLNQQKLAATLGVTQGRISQINTGREPMPEHMAVKLAELLGIEPITALIKLRAEYSETAEVKKHWLKLATGTAAALVIAPISYLGNFAQCIFITRRKFNTCAL